jgi:hypothetical protein
MKEKLLNNLNNAVVSSINLYHEETIRIESDSVDYEEGFRMQYNDEWEVIRISYWRLELIPNSNKRHYVESPLTPDEQEKLINWFDKKVTQETKNKRERQVIFPKKAPVQMTEL